MLKLVEIGSFLVFRNTTNWSPDWCPELSKSIKEIQGIFLKFAIKIASIQWVFYIQSKLLNEMILCVIFSRRFLWNTTQKILIKFFVLLDIFSIRFSPYLAIDPSKIIEVVVNLFMKLQTSNFTKFNDLGVKLKEIKLRIRIVCQFNQFCSEKCQISKAFGK